MRLVHDVLDARLVDRNDLLFGRVDRIVIRVEGDEPPTIVAIEIGAVAIAERAHPRLGRWMSRLLARGRGPARPFAIAIALLTRDGNDFRADLDATTTPAWAGEQWARERLVGRIPGAS